MTPEGFLGVIRSLYQDLPWPSPLHVVRAVQRVREGQDPRIVARESRTSSAAVQAGLAAPEVVAHALGLPAIEVSEGFKRKAGRTLGQLLLGRCAELAFEDLYRREMGSQHLELRDLRESRSDTDYRLFDAHERPLYRINIKFHGSLFRRAAELVDLDPSDCFALATYKIHSALLKQDQEHLPYFFAIVGVPGLTGDALGGDLPRELVDATAVVYAAKRFVGKRDFEDRIVASIVAGRSPVFRSTLEQVQAARWYILSARRADNLLHEKLFDRVYALRIRGFAQNFRSAELDMHLSLSTDLTPLVDFFAALRTGGLTKVATLLERGSI